MAAIGPVNLRGFWSNECLGPYGEDPEKKTPFNFHIFPDLLDQKVVSQLRDDVNSCIKLKPKDNDLYKFHQSKDIKTEIPSKRVSPLLHKFIDIMLGDVRTHLEKSTGLKLSSKNFDITASRYEIGNYLLCHNDDIKDTAKHHARALAFVYYLNTRTWTKEDGGALIIYDHDERGEPVAINNRISPRPNTLVVFNTTSTSWHSVQEVFCQDDFRLSINGWFHTDGLPIKINESQVEASLEPCPYTFVKPIPLDDRLEKFFNEFINPKYLMEPTCMQVRRKFKKNSEINLSAFLIKEKFKEISKALRETVADETNLTHIGPYNKRNFKVIKHEKLPDICKDLYDAFKSELFFMLLSRLTGLDLQPPSLKRDKDTDDGNEDEEVEGEEEDDDDDDDEDSDEDDEEDDDDDEEEEDDDEEEQEVSKYVEVENGGGIKKVKRDHVEETKDLKDNEKNEAAPTTSKALVDEIKQIPKKRKRISNPLGRLEFRHLEHGSYTLLHDYAYEMGEKSALDVVFHFNHDFEVNFDHGGYISYIDAEEPEEMHDMDCELLTVEPRSNCLSLAYRLGEGNCRFLKYITKSHKSSYQDLYCVYYEKPDDLPDSGAGVKFEK